ncbi:hypothetical protein [Paenibacillus tianmuensis]|uniref:hypothetical protein n=1 Tax=Paenibacillus tianmuensis TaxID=624147 RepID=UPI000B877B26|nr:hypothetical protein [Paenibacillus tianmuensis]
MTNMSEPGLYFFYDRHPIAVAFHENASFLATAISSEVMAVLKSFNAIMATLTPRTNSAVFSLLPTLAHRSDRLLTYGQMLPSSEKEDFNTKMQK